MTAPHPVPSIVMVDWVLKINYLSLQSLPLTHTPPSAITIFSVLPPQVFFIISYVGFLLLFLFCKLVSQAFGISSAQISPRAEVDGLPCLTYTVRQRSVVMLCFMVCARRHACLLLS